MNHLTDAELETIVMGISPATEQARHHLRECEACAARLAREARLELAFTERESVVQAGPGRLPIWAFAAAASIVLVIGALFVLPPRSFRPGSLRAASVRTPVPDVLHHEPPGLHVSEAFMPGRDCLPPVVPCLRAQDTQPIFAIP